MTRRGKTQDTTTIQLWPGGQSVEYRGDPDGPANQKSLRDGHYSARIRCAGDCSRVWTEDNALYMQGSAAPLSSVFVNVADDPRAGKHCIGDPLNYPERVTVCGLCKGEGFTPNPKRNPWRKGTPDEWRRIRIELRAKMYADRDILTCDSALVDDLLKEGDREGFTVDDLENVYQDPSDWDADRCREYAEDQGIDVRTVVHAVCQHCDQDIEGAAPFKAGEWRDRGNNTTCPTPEGDAGQKHEPEIDPDDDEDYIEELRDACREHAQDNPAEVYEWWRVTGWLCGQLRAIGEVVIDNGYGNWWGRCCTGQGYLMDGTLQTVAAQFERGTEE